MNLQHSVVGLTVLGTILAANGGVAQLKLLDRSNLIAWCIVPFDAKHRNPEERAEMLRKLGITKLAYDWREKDIPTFDAEVDALKRNRIKLSAFWATVSFDKAKNRHLPVILDLFRRRRIHPELWTLLTPPADFDKLPQDQKVDRAAAILKPVAEQFGKAGSKIGLYNHGGWFGEPENQIAILKRMGLQNVGLVYNFHHAHEHIARFPELFQTMKPYLLAVNINGMKSGGSKILSVGDGDAELPMIRTVLTSGWRGPIGILNHQTDVDAEVGLQRNLAGIEKLRSELQ